MKTPKYPPPDAFYGILNGSDSISVIAPPWTPKGELIALPKSLRKYPEAFIWKS